MCSIQSERTEYNYPVSAVGINITTIVSDEIYLFQGQYNLQRATFWGIFDSDILAFFHMFSITFRIFDFLWSDMQAKYQNAGQVLNRSREMLKEILATNPSSTKELAEGAQKLGYIY